jgi:predicted RNA binding protein YcfA (HicA-like mRNA interferase family)
VTDLHFVVEDAPEGAYLACAIGADIFTEADDLNALHAQLRDAVPCHFDPVERPSLNPSSYHARVGHRRVKIPRDLSATTLIHALRKLGYIQVGRPAGHILLTTTQAGEQQVTIPNQDPIRMGTLSAILNSVAVHHGLTRAQLLKELFG